MKRLKVLGAVGVVLVMAFAHSAMASPNLVAGRAVDPAIDIYKVAKDGLPGEIMCTIPFKESVVDFTNDEFGCVNDDAYFFSVVNAPSAAEIWLLSEKNCDVDNAKADWMFHLKTTNKVVNTEALRIKGLSAFLPPEGEFKPVVVVKGLQLVGGLVNDNHIDGKLSCVKIKPSKQDTSSVSTPRVLGAQVMVGDRFVAPPAIAAGATLTLYGAEGNEQCSMAFSTYIYRFFQWHDENGEIKPPTNPGKCPNDDAYFFSLRNVPSASMIYFSSEAVCDLNKSTSDWIFQLKTTQSNLSSGQIKLSQLSGLPNGKPLPPPDRGLLMVDSFHGHGNVDGKLSCIKIVLGTPDSN